MNILPGALPITHAPDPVMATRPDRAPTPAIVANDPAARSRGETHGETGNRKKGGDNTSSPVYGRVVSRLTIGPPPDPDRPTGPPPAFEASLLESERERMMDGPEINPGETPTPAPTAKSESRQPAPSGFETPAAPDRSGGKIDITL